MKILLVIDHLDPGGAQHQMVTLAASLTRRGHDVSCFVYYPEMDHHRRVLDEAGVHVYAVPKPSRFSLHVPLQLRKLVWTGFDVSLSYLTTPNVYNVLSTVATGVPSVVSERSALPSGGPSLSTRFKYQFYRLADRVIVNSDHHRQDLGEVFRWMKPKLVIIRNGVDLQLFTPSARPRTVRQHALNLLAVGSLNSGKNFIGLIEAIRVHRERFGWTPSVSWVGRKGTSAIDVHAMEQAEHLIDRYRLRAQWEWLGVRRDVPDLMRTADALVHPSFFEGLPNVVCEALASGLPVLAGKVCDHPWLVGEDERGLLFDPSDPTDIALSIQQFSRLGESEREMMARRARSFAERELSLDGLADQYERLFEEVAPTAHK
ncbi:MAG TPA: glycosyltransferase family 4 protein [Rhodothermia bacterium]